MSELVVAHTVIEVTNIEKARLFYDKVLSFLGLKLIVTKKTTTGYSNGKTGIWIHECQKKFSKAKFVRGRPGYDHIALAAESREQINKLQDFLKKEKFNILYPAAEHPEFAPDYYSISFKDPDETIIELVHPCL